AEEKRSLGRAAYERIKQFNVESSADSIIRFIHTISGSEKTLVTDSLPKGSINQREGDTCLKNRRSS
ncbi:MAG: hypothetical protein ACYDBV_02325, partial [Nitrospiria bacterium]